MTASSRCCSVGVRPFDGGDERLVGGRWFGRWGVRCAPEGLWSRWRSPLLDHRPWGEPLVVGRHVELDASGDEHADGVGVASEPHGFMDGLITDPVDVVAVDTSAQEAADDPRLAALGGADRAVPFPGVLVVDVGTRGEVASRMSGARSLAARR